MENSSQIVNDYNNSPRKTTPVKGIVLGIIILALVAGASYLGYLAYNKTNEVNSLQQTVSTIKNEKAALEKSLEALQPKSDALAITYSNAKHYWEYAGSELDIKSGAPDLLIVNVSMKNTDTKPVQFSRSKLLIKGKDNTSYPLATASPLKSQPRFANGIEGLPNGAIEIQDQVVQPGKTINGVVVFYVAQKNLDFVISYGGVEQAITAQPGDYKFLTTAN